MNVSSYIIVDLGFIHLQVGHCKCKFFQRGTERQMANQSDTFVKETKALSFIQAPCRLPCNISKQPRSKICFIRS